VEILLKILPFFQPKYKEEPVEDDRAKIMELVDSLENTAEGETDVLDETALKRMILLFEKRALKNQEMRIKFPDSPEKYLLNRLLFSLLKILF
jgi:beta-catenin-like protein 1